MSNISRLGYTTPTPIQERAIPDAMQGRDLMGLAQTGTGKTAAFLLPIITKLLKENAERRPGRKPRTLILAPTRELAEQIHDSTLDLARNTGLRSTTVYGGVNMNRQINALRNGADIVVACPGRLLDHMGQRTVDLTAVETLVLDEADQMFDMGFLPDIRKVLAGLPKDRQTMLFSATMPEAIRGLASEILKQPETIRAGENAPSETVEHAIYPVPQHLKTKLLLEILRRNTEGSMLVFTRTKHRAKRLAETLEKQGHKATALQGNLSQNRRKEAMDGFRSGRYRVLVATDIAARGIDVSQITHVVNFDVPSTPETYTHRIGRTGRAARTGEAHTFVTGEDLSMVRAIERLLHEPLKRKKLEGFNYDETPSTSAADRDFNRPIMDRRGGYGARSRSQYGQGRGQGDRRQGDRQQAQGQRRDGGQDDRREGGYGQRREGGGQGQRAAAPYGQQGGNAGGGLFEHHSYGALRSDIPDSYDANIERRQPGDDIYTDDRHERRSGNGRPQGAHAAAGKPGEPRRAGGRDGRPQGAAGQNRKPRAPRRQGDSRPETRDARGAVER